MTHAWYDTRDTTLVIGYSSCVTVSWYILSYQILLLCHGGICDMIRMPDTIVSYQILLLCHCVLIHPLLSCVLLTQRLLDRYALSSVGTESLSSVSDSVLTEPPVLDRYSLSSVYAAPPCLENLNILTALSCLRKMAHAWTYSCVTVSSCILLIMLPAILLVCENGIAEDILLHEKIKKNGMNPLLSYFPLQGTNVKNVKNKNNFMHSILLSRTISCILNLLTRKKLPFFPLVRRFILCTFSSK
jgi:hypothetical protein